MEFRGPASVVALHAASRWATHERTYARHGAPLVIATLLMLASAAAQPATLLPLPAANSLRAIADAGPDIVTNARVPVVIDGSQSHDDAWAARAVAVGTTSNAGTPAAIAPRGPGNPGPASGLVTYAWRLADAPPGSAASIDPAAPAPVFVADLPGRYVLQLVVTGEDGVASLPSQTMVTAYPAYAPRPAPAPLQDVDNAGAAQPRAVSDADGTSIDLDGRASVFDGARPPAAYRWSLVARPPGSVRESADIDGATQASARFAPDVAGDYVFRLAVAEAQGADARNVRIGYDTDAAHRAAEANVALGAKTMLMPPRRLDAPGPREGSAPDYEVSVQPSRLAIAADGEAKATVALVAHERFGMQAVLRVAGLPPGVSAHFDRRALAAGARTTLTLRADPATATGDHPLQVMASVLVDGRRSTRIGELVVAVHRSVGDAVPVACAGSNPAGATRVYVSPGGHDTAGCGSTPANACASIQHGIDTCSGAGCAVLLRHGLYTTTATINLRNGVGVIGGCVFDATGNRNDRTVIEASPAPGTPALSATGLNQPTVLDNIVVIGKDEPAIGTASIAMAVSASGGLSMGNVTLAAGRGGDGANGNSASAAGGAGGAGTGGASGGTHGSSCPSNHVADSGDGGDGGTSQDGYVISPTCHISSRGNVDGHASGNVVGGAHGGAGGAGLFCNGSNWWAPGNGNTGNNGSAGECGPTVQASGLATGWLQGGTWQPGKGQDGQPGLVGSGGGGGGAGGVCSYLTNRNGAIDHYGLPGGGGGGGGCGGNAGQGGGQGGASLALVMVDGTLGPQSTLTLVPGPAGQGGTGGNATSGGKGGAAGAGKGDGQTLFWGHYCGGTGAAGGSGGYGGAGSAGAGGDGGPSLGVALGGSAVAPATGLTAYASLPGTPGKGGGGGAAAPVKGACKGNDGPAGNAGAGGAGRYVPGDPPHSVLAPGEQLLMGQSRTSPDGNTQLIMQPDGNFCLYKSKAYQWCSLQKGLGTANFATMQTDGNLCLTNGSAKHCTNTAPNAGAWLAVHDDGTAVILGGGKLLWKIP